MLREKGKVQQSHFQRRKNFNLDGPDGFKYYWHDLRKKKTFLTHQNEDGSVMV